MIGEEIGKVLSTDLLPVCVFHHRFCMLWGPLQLARDHLFPSAFLLRNCGVL